MSQRHNSSAQNQSQASAALADEAPNWRAFFDDHLRDLYRFLYMWTGNRVEAEQLTTRAFMEATHVGHDDDSQMQTSAQSRHLLFQIARRLLAEHLRSFYHLSNNVVSDALIFPWDTSATRRDATPPCTPEECIAHILQHLSVREREVLTYRFMLQRSLTETAALMGLSADAARQLQFQALRDASRVIPDDLAAESRAGR